MIQPPGGDGVAFTGAGDGDQRSDAGAREQVSGALGITPRWAWVRQVHGNGVREAVSPGDHGEADALWTTVRQLPLAVFTADCFGVVLRAPDAVGVAHAGWRGVSSGVVPALFDSMAGAGHRPRTAFIGPGIGPCCFEVGAEVAAAFEDDTTVTTWGSTSVDLVAAIRSQISGLELSEIGSCTRHDEQWLSYRRDGTAPRQVTLGWLP
jgi:polyphenol oxidase